LNAYNRTKTRSQAVAIADRIASQQTEIGLLSSN